MCLCDSLCCVVDSIATTNTIPSNCSHSNDCRRCSKWEIKKLFADSLSMWDKMTRIKDEFSFSSAKPNCICHVQFCVESRVMLCLCVSFDRIQSLDEFKTTTTTSSGICPNIVAGCSIRFDRCWYERKRNKKRQSVFCAKIFARDAIVKCRWHCSIFSRQLLVHLFAMQFKPPPRE